MPKPATRRTATRAPAPTVSTAVRGSKAGLKRMEEEQKKAEQRREASKATANQPFRYFLKPGQTGEIVIVDDEPSFFRNEHALKNPRSGRFDLFLPCIDEQANCPACTGSDKQAYFAMYLTVIDLTPYTKRDTDEVIEWSKKLLVIKLTQQKKIARLLDQHGSLRGMVLQMTRDNDKSAAIGNDIDFIEFMDEEELLEYESEYTDREDKVHEIIGHEPFDYDEIYPDMSERQLAALVGGGSMDDEERPAPRRAASRRGRDEEEEEAPPRRGAKAATRRGAKVEEEEEEEAPPRRSASRRGRDEEEEEPAPKRGRTARKAVEEEEEEEPAPRRGRAARAPVEEEEEEEAPPRRTASRRAARDEEEEEEEVKPARTASRRGRAVEEEDPPQRTARRASRQAEEEEEDDPLPPKTDRASKRAGLRR